MVERNKEKGFRRGYLFRYRTIQKLDAMKKNPVFRNETDVVETAIDYLFQAVERGEFSESSLEK